MGNNYIFNSIPIPRYDLADKDGSYNYYMRYLFCRTQSMFRYKNLPDSIPQRDLELQIQMFGHVGVFHNPEDGNLYALRGSFADKPNAYYIPTKYVISNPGLSLSKIFDIDDNIIIIPNDSMYTGLSPLFSRYCTQMLENDLSLLVANINSRIVSLIIAGDDRASESAKKYIQAIRDGHLSVIGDNKLLESLRTQPYGDTSANMSQLIEYQQYLKAGVFNEIGLNANYNMKREAINSDEAQMNHDALFPLIDDMLHTRQLAIDKVNDMFGTDISVEFNSVWEKSEELLEQTMTEPEQTEEVVEDVVTEPEDEQKEGEADEG